ncbi:hypothetical protein ENU1_144160 [Entamoeba nuttalli P19]|uniref:Uncharacterized protein n=1 Tax=Entamoeba nuttalli (strain P19) TaxID=1076696 RepID=K2H8Y6_ENTNP|nr:hypothetical protein ENU1_144160 [Entamoeba nuttalli P19]EKE39019.1 hypothetical protein ENU1_144160 [Entamoeba nuttalli P19]|eukprot:XP_008858639.1 hypothetical protein ENU1_144160 [Entamoeba nuttalli P19]
MKKFDIKEQQYAFYTGQMSNDVSFSFGYGFMVDIRVYKENNKRVSYCDQNTYEYKGISNALCGKQRPERFTPKHFIDI